MSQQDLPGGERSRVKPGPARAGARRVKEARAAPPAIDDDGKTVESRCVCGNLLARLTDSGVELKCRRCKRLVLIAWNDFSDVQPRDPPA